MTSSMFYYEEFAISMIWQTTIGSHGRHQIKWQKTDHAAKIGSHGKKQVSQDKSGTKRNLQEPNGDPGYGVTVQINRQTDRDTKSKYRVAPNLKF